MRLLLNTTDLQQVQRFTDFGVIAGITTNPPLLARSAAHAREVISRICEIFSGPVSVQPVGDGADALYSIGKEVTTIAPNIVIKLPATIDGFAAAGRRSADGIQVNITLCFSLEQALWAFSLNASYLSVFSGRLADVGNDGQGILSEIVEVRDRDPQVRTKIIAASLTSVAHVIAAARAGADLATTSPEILERLLTNALTQEGLEAFTADWIGSRKSL